MLQGRASVQFIRIIALALVVPLAVLSFSVPAGTAIGSDARWDWSFSNADLRIDLGYDQNREEAVIVFAAVSGRSISVNYHVGSLSRITDLTGHDASLLVSTNRQAFQLNKHFPVQLAADNPTAEYRLKLARDLNLPAGEYRIELVPSSRDWPTITLTLCQPKLYQLQVTGSPIEFAAMSGPGYYPAKEPITVQVRTNYSGWRLKVHATPLALVADARSDEVRRIPLEQLLVSLDPDGDFVPLTKDGVILGGVQSGSALFTVYMFLQSTWDDFAGVYDGGSVSFRIVD